MSWTYPRTATGARSAGEPPKRTARWCAMVPPAESPDTKTRPRSAASATQGSPPPCLASHRTAAAPSSMAAGRRCSGARR
uniref:Uncharacterized protein n=1 Tax=Zea mays TaxID=4577 RepID=C4J5K6_MAIZE|nr:unknown [Zea mays]